MWKTFTDPQIKDCINREFKRQSTQICLIASENITLPEVMKAQGSVLMHKYAEGYPKKRYYEGCSVCDDVEQLAIDRLCELFGVQYANVQPHSGSQANQAVFFACLKPGDRILGMDLSSGGHLTHGFKHNISGMYYNAKNYTVDPDTCLIDYDQIRNLAIEHKPKLIIAGGSSYPRNVDWAKIRQIADEIGALFMADIAHTAGLIAGGAVPSPAQYAHVMTSTTHKTLRGPRGGVIMTNDSDLIKKINRAVMPGIQGGPMMHTIAAKAVCFHYALSDDFKRYARNVVKNAQTMAQEFTERGLRLTTGGTDNHSMVLDVSNLHTTGRAVAENLAVLGIITNKNAVPNDKLPITETSGIRLGTAFVTSCGFTTDDCKRLAKYIADVILHETVDDIQDLFDKVTQAYGSFR